MGMLTNQMAMARLRGKGTMSNFKMAPGAGLMELMPFPNYSLSMKKKKPVEHSVAKKETTPSQVATPLGRSKTIFSGYGATADVARKALLGS